MQPGTQGERILSGVAMCQSCGAGYPVQDGIGMFLTPTLRRDDLWETAESNLSAYLRAHPDLERALLDSPLEALNPADQFFRMMVLEARGDFAQAKRIERVSQGQLYTHDYLACWQSALDHVLDRVRDADPAAPILDIACGRGYLVERLANLPDRVIIATDFSPRVLRRNRAYWSASGLSDQVTLLACDARRMPFKPGAVSVMTTNLGLTNISDPHLLLPELRRICGGVFLAVTFFFAPEDALHAQVLRQNQTEALAFRDSALAQFAAAKWQAQVAAHCTGLAKPTPASVILDGARIDAVPVTETTLDWGVLTAHPA